MNPNALTVIDFETGKIINPHGLPPIRRPGLPTIHIPADPARGIPAIIVVQMPAPPRQPDTPKRLNPYDAENYFILGGAVVMSLFIVMLLCVFLPYTLYFRFLP